jgi:UDP-glucose 4-epimerase
MTITDPEMTRFLMPLHEAVDLVMHTLKEGQNGDIFVHKAKASNIANVAQACAKLANKVADIEIIGVRGGEKQHETLATSEELARSEDQGKYWRIQSEQGQNFDKFFSKGRVQSADSVGFDSCNAEQLDVDQIVSMIQGLPEYETLVSGRRNYTD